MSAVLQTLYSTTHEKLDTFARLGDLLVHYWSLFLAVPVLLSAAYSCDWHAILCVILTLLVVHKLSKHILEACRRGTRRESRTDILMIPGARDRMTWADAHGLLREALQNVSNSALKRDREHEEKKAVSPESDDELSLDEAEKKLHAEADRVHEL